MPETKKSPHDKAESMAARRVSLAARLRTVADEEERSGFKPLADEFRGRALAIADSDEGAQAFRFDGAQGSEMMSPMARCLAGV